jgi:hypothetical protein
MNSQKYIGMDVHRATISVAVMDSKGKLIMECVLETKERRFWSSSKAFPADAYKEIIDQLVNETSHGVVEKIVRERGSLLGTSDHAVYKPFVRSLSTEQRFGIGPHAPSGTDQRHTRCVSGFDLVDSSSWGGPHVSR